MWLETSSVTPPELPVTFPKSSVTMPKPPVTLLRNTHSNPKYSKNQKQKAVEHYAEHGCCIASTIKALGYPGRDSLRAWIGEFQPDSRQHVVRSAVSSPRPPELKKLAVLELCTREGSAQGVAQKLGVSRPTLYNWKNTLAGPEVPASMKRRKDLTPEPQPERAELERQVESLRRDIRHPTSDIRHPTSDICSSNTTS